MSLLIDLARNEEEFLQAARLRYRVTVEEMGLEMFYADHATRTVVEPLDATGHVLLAKHHGREIVGTLRINFLRDGDVGHYYRSYGIELLPEQVNRSAVSITTRLAVSAAFRGQLVAPLLQAAVFRFARTQGMTHDVIDCRRRLRPYFQVLGYLEHIPQFTHPEFGDVVVQYLPIRNSEYLRSIASPLLKLSPDLGPGLQSCLKDSQDVTL